jgi:hypothetical protein
MHRAIADIFWHWRSPLRARRGQAAHAALDFGRLCGDAATAGLRVARFHEPDLGGSLTAAALEPAGRRLVSRLRRGPAAA